MASHPVHDLNMEVAGLLRDMALIHSSPHGRIAYKRAAHAVLALDQLLDSYVQSGELRELRYIGPASERVILEFLERGESPTVARAVVRAGKQDEIREAHAHRSNFLSRAGALRALCSRARDSIRLADYRGDLQMHSTWSDGGESIARLAEAAQARGYEYIGVSDHSYGLRIARGMSMESVALQHREIDALNERWGGTFRVFKGIETNIPADGGVDMKPEELARFELVLAAPHSKLRKAEDQTARMVETVRNRHVHILAHPRGRMYSRQGVLARWDEVFEEAARQGVAVEIDGDPYRQDLDFALARRALAAGCLFALDSDAHAGDELASSELAVAHARLAEIPAERVLNCWPAQRLLEWSRAKRAPRAARAARLRP